MKPDIFTYLEYRAFLKDAFEAVKAGSPRLSYRSFARKAGFTSPNFLQMVIQGKRNLSSTYAMAVARAFKLNRQESEFFRNLIGYDQARSPDEKDLFYQRILAERRFTKVKHLDKSQYEFFSHWYIPVVREMLSHRLCNGESAWIAERIHPRITPSQVESARDLLVKLGLIRMDGETGKWIETDAVVSTVSEPTHLALRNYHKSAIQLAHDSLKSFGPAERDIRSITIGLSEAAFGELKSKLEAAWKDVLEFAGRQQQAEAVYQVNLQLFPLTREKKERT